jgi:hypothetical protein
MHIGWYSYWLSLETFLTSVWARAGLRASRVIWLQRVRLGYYSSSPVFVLRAGVWRTRTETEDESAHSKKNGQKF